MKVLLGTELKRIVKELLTAETVYKVTEALSQKEKSRLYDMLKQDHQAMCLKSGKKLKAEYSDIEALRHLRETLLK